MRNLGQYRLYARLVGLLLLVMAAVAAALSIISLLLCDGVWRAMLASCAMFLSVGLLCYAALGRRPSYRLGERDSLRITFVVWIVVPLFGVMPYLFSGLIPSFTDAMFESVSGFTTTGSTVVLTPSSWPVSMLLWRAATQWIGGLGLVLIIVALLHRLYSGSLRLYDAEFSGTQQRKLHPRIAVSVSRMWRIYAAMTAVMALLLWLTGTDAVSAACLAMSTVSTGGFMPCELSALGNVSLFVLTLFMFLSGVNVALLYNFFTFRWRLLRRNSEFRAYLSLFLLSAVLCGVAFSVGSGDVPRAMARAMFHSASTISTCGFYLPDGSRWPVVVSGVTFLLMVVGACSGSTGGGLKVSRVMVLLKYLRNYFTRMLHPKVVFSVRMNNNVVPADYVNRIFGFAFLYMGFVILGAFALTFCGLSLTDSFSVSLANISNLGPSISAGVVAGASQYAVLPSLAKWILVLLMLAGRVEIFAVVALVSPSYWRRR